jgi:N-hydroxyarylamine O-acetyltransferase
MQATNFNIRAYLSRIGFRGRVAADCRTLRGIMQAQLFSVPFENLDVQAGKTVSLAPDDIYRKIVEHRRGGYCYEVNGVFAMALAALGIPYRLVAARPMTYPVRRPKTHMALVAEIGGEQWLCDLGFGSHGIREPLNLEWLDREIRQGPAGFMLTKSAEGEYLLQSLSEGTWMSLYEFNLSAQEWVDFEPANYLNATHPDSIFVRALMVVLQTPTGKKVLHGERFSVVSEDYTEERTASPEEIAELLLQEFALDCRQ